MLLLSRKVNQKIVINGNIIVKVCRIERGDEVKIGIEAPSDIPVHREEIYDQIQKKQNETAPIPATTVSHSVPRRD